ALHAADADKVGARRDRLDDVGAAAERAIDQDLRAPGDGVHDLGQYLHGAAAVIELPPAVVGDVNPVHAVIERNPGVLGGRNALDDERNLDPPLDPLDRRPVEPGLERAALHTPAAGGHESLGNVALAPAVVRGIDGEAEGGIAMGNGSFHVIVDPGHVAAHIQLKEPQ